MNINEEKLRYISGFLDDSIEELIYTALDSNGKNCRYSFVTIEKIILCYIDLENAPGNLMVIITSKSISKQICFPEKNTEDSKGICLMNKK